ncbi:MAG: aldolase/citrate lyase family protein, partial [Burkholderiaceae bacterium]
VPGVDGLFIGRADLALAMGLEDAKHPDVLAAADASIAAALAAGKLAGVFAGTAAERDRYAAQGVNWFVMGSDQSLLRQGAAAMAHRQA